MATRDHSPQLIGESHHPLTLLCAFIGLNAIIAALISALISAIISAIISLIISALIATCEEINAREFGPAIYLNVRDAFIRV